MTLEWYIFLPWHGPYHPYFPISDGSRLNTRPFPLIFCTYVYLSTRWSGMPRKHLLSFSIGDVFVSAYPSTYGTVYLSFYLKVGVHRETGLQEHVSCWTCGFIVGTYTMYDTDLTSSYTSHTHTETHTPPIYLPLLNKINPSPSPPTFTTLPTFLEYLLLLSVELHIYLVSLSPLFVVRKDFLSYYFLFLISVVLLWTLVEYQKKPTLPLTYLLSLSSFRLIL